MASYGTFQADLAQSGLSHGQRPSWGWDYVFSFRAPKVVEDLLEDITPEELAAVNRSREQTLVKLREAGFSYKQLWVPSDGVVLVCIGLDEGTLMQKAELIGMELKLKPRFGAGYFTFTVERSQCYENALRADAGKPYFCPADRTLIILGVLRSRDAWGAGIDREKLIFRKRMVQSFAVHCEPERTDLVRKAVVEKSWNPFSRLPLDDMKNYLGARVTLYFAFLSFYARMLSGIAAFSLFAFIVIEYATSKTIIALMRFAFGMALIFWATYFIAYWQRRNAVLNIKWGLNDFYEDTENDIRPQFVGTRGTGFYCNGGFVSLEDLDPNIPVRIPSTAQMQIVADEGVALDSDRESDDNITLLGRVRQEDADFQLDVVATGETFDDLPRYPHVSKQVFRQRIYRTATTTLFFALCMAGATFLLLFYKSSIVQAFGEDGFGVFIPGILNGLLISVADNVWKQVSMTLTRWENHRTNQSYENSLVRKRFAFQFVSNYVSLFYIAFVKPYTPNDPCHAGWDDDQPDCMAELESTLVSLVLTKATVQQLLEVGIPFITVRIKQWRQRNSFATMREERLLSERPELSGHVPDEDNRFVVESKLAPYRSTIEDYGELVIQYGFLVLFGLPFPLAALINFLNNLVEMRTDAFKILNVSQRTDASDAADIGEWLFALKFLSTISIVTNSAMLVFTAKSLDFLDRDIDTPLDRALAFMFIEHLLFLMQWVIRSAINSSPGRTHRLLARQEYLIYRWFGVGWKPYYRPAPLVDDDDDDTQNEYHMD